MQLQVALDRIELGAATRVAATVAPHADWIEVGTSLIKRYGMTSVAETVAAAGSTPVLADLKTADDAATEFGMAFEHGARAATVLATATDQTVERCAALAHDANAEVLLDLLATSASRRDQLLRKLPPDVIFAAHVGKDAQSTGDGPGAILGDWVRGRRVAVAGGITESGLTSLADAPAAQLRVIVGSAITTAPDPAAAARRMSTTSTRSTA
ncbi:3-keto-L-gulonate-6-phosphate decarboxylase [Saccharopolyspora lacisalsi]|uniref:3-keto-L-gulonate-6-phosphate decarboxylase n=1 Tax=Halosaccharopolyspora lacisalsi TaxID=1000566 RepID=A0A839DWL9_9PSEU|nr:orotidine 5'-phosphate decarboxylase / HUMPS family protein [Halosaccharopolyspora lacisalsi]MBA8823591.1 3-keto-L-gulonate-6-phosphate decarboxylase [Halosaccharopolyspora lacisalsi]